MVACLTVQMTLRASGSETALSMGKCQPLPPSSQSDDYMASFTIFWPLAQQGPSSHRQHALSSRLVQGSEAASSSEVSLPQLPAA